MRESRFKRLIIYTLANESGVRFVTLILQSVACWLDDVQSRPLTLTAVARSEKTLWKSIHEPTTHLP